MDKQFIKWLEQKASSAPTWNETQTYFKVIDKIKTIKDK